MMGILAGRQVRSLLRLNIVVLVVVFGTEINTVHTSTIYVQ